MFYFPLSLVWHHLCFPEATCWHLDPLPLWTRMTKTGLMPFRKPRQQWVSKIWLRFSSSHTHTHALHTVPGARRAEAHLSHTHYREGHGSHSDTLRLALSDVSGSPCRLCGAQTADSPGYSGNRDSHLFMLFSDSKRSIILKKLFVPRELRYQQHSQLLVFPFFFSAPLFMNSFLSARKRETKLSFFSVFLCIKGEQTVTILSFFLSRSFQHKGTWQQQWRIFFPSNSIFVVWREGENNSIFSTSKNRISFSTW